jgi:hypothetical protein
MTLSPVDLAGAGGNGDPETDATNSGVGGPCPEGVKKRRFVVRG